MKHYLSWIALGLLAFSVSAHAATIDFTTFVPSSSIDSAESGTSAPNGNGSNALNSTIAFTYAGDEFVGSVYYDTQLYVTSLTGGLVTAFGSPLPESPSAVGEVVVGASLGQAGFTNGNLFVGSGADTKIFQYANGGGAPSLFATLPSGAGDIRQIFFDPGSTFGGNMLVTTSSGQIYEVMSNGTFKLLVNVGEDAEGMDIAPSTFGPYAGDLMVSSEGSGTLRFINPAGTIVASVGGLGDAETVSAIPMTLDSTNPLEGFYVANYPDNIQFASAGQFITQSLLGTVIVTSESPGTDLAWDLTYNSGTSSFSYSPFTFNGNSVNQFEDGIFVTPQRISDTGNPTPEPSSFILLGSGLLGLAGSMKRKLCSHR